MLSSYNLYLKLLKIKLKYIDKKIYFCLIYYPMEFLKKQNFFVCLRTILATFMQLIGLKKKTYSIIIKKNVGNITSTGALKVRNLCGLVKSNTYIVSKLHTQTLQ